MSTGICYLQASGIPLIYKTDLAAACSGYTSTDVHTKTIPYPYISDLLSDASLHCDFSLH